jgi:hypothetical protein
MPELWARIIAASTVSGKQQQQHCWLYGKTTDTLVQVTGFAVLPCMQICITKYEHCWPAQFVPVQVAA